MKRKRWVIIAIILVLVGGYTAGIYNESQKLSKQQLSHVGENGNREKIVKNVLKVTDRGSQYDVNDVEQVCVYYGEVNGEDGMDAVVSVGFASQDTVVAAYSLCGQAYEYLGEIGRFCGIEAIDFVPLVGDEKTVVVVQEAVYPPEVLTEHATLLHGYLFDGQEAFYDVLHTTIHVDAMYYDSGQGLQTKEFQSWKKFLENVEMAWEITDNIPVLSIVRYQKYEFAQSAMKATSEEKNQQLDNRVLTEEFYWSEPWQRFVMGEAREKRTGKSVAILDNSEHKPYVLAGVEEKGYLVLRKDGTQEILKADELEWTKKPKGNVP